jgi:hypothetical protein
VTGLQVRGRLAVRLGGPAALPEEFTWRGRRHVVRRLERLTGLARAERFRITTQDGLRCIVRQDSAPSGWRLERVLPGRQGGVGG